MIECVPRADMPHDVGDRVCNPVRGGSIRGRAEGTRLPARGLLHHQPAGVWLHHQPAGVRLHHQPAGAVAFTTPATSLSRSVCRTGRRRSRTRQTCAQLPRGTSRRSEKTRHLPTTTRVTPDRLDNPNRPVSILSNSEPALCALAPAPNHYAASVPDRSHGFAHTCRRARVAAATPKTAPPVPRLAVSPGRNQRSGDPPPPTQSATSPSRLPAPLPTAQ